MRMHAATIYGYSYKEMLSKSIPLATCTWCNRVVAYDIDIRKTSYSTCVIIIIIIIIIIINNQVQPLRNNYLAS